MSDMFNSFKAMQQGNDLESTQKALEAQNASSSHSEDTRFYYPERDKAGNGSAVIRFLPPAMGETLPYQRFYSHGFEVNGKWFINECLTTKGEQCPVCEDNDTLWKSGKAGQDIVRGVDGKNGRKRKMRYVANILVVKDPANPENEGKTFLMQFGYKIEAMIQEAFKGDSMEGIPPCNPFNYWTGRDFLLKIKKVAGQTNYDSSKFMPAGKVQVGGKEFDDSKLEELWKGQHKLTPDYAEKLDYTTYEKQKAHLDKILGKVAAGKSTPSAADMASADAPSQPQEAQSSAPSAAAQSGEEEDFFNNL